MESIEDNKVKNFFSNKYVGMIGTVASVIGLLLAIYFYDQSKKYPALIYYVNPVKAVVVKSDKASHLNIFYEQNKITKDITAVQVAIWNDGTESIRNENILKPIVLTTKNKSDLIELTVRNYSRDVINFNIINDSIDQSRAEFNWTIMERDDWVIIQVIFAGDTNEDIVIDGVIEGQSKIEKYEYGGNIQSVPDQISAERNGKIAVGISFVFMGGLLLIVSFYARLKAKKQKKLEREIEEYEKVEKDFLKVMDRKIELYNSYFNPSKFMSEKLFRPLNKRLPLFRAIIIIASVMIFIIGLFLIYTSTISTLPFSF